MPSMKREGPLSPGDRSGHQFAGARPPAGSLSPSEGKRSNPSARGISGSLGYLPALFCGVLRCRYAPQTLEKGFDSEGGVRSNLRLAGISKFAHPL